MERNANSMSFNASADLPAKDAENPQRTHEASRGLESESGLPNQEHVSKTRFPGQRGRQKRPTKVLVTMRFSPEVLEFFKAAGEGWQTRINEVLREHVSHHRSD